MGKRAFITQSDYIPWKGYFDSINLVDEFIIYDDAQYTRRDWRNRNKIKTPQGVAWLTIPVEVKGKYLQKIKDTKIGEPLWYERHWTILERNYCGAAHFREYSGIIKEMYFSATSNYLSEVNYLFLTGISQILGISTRVRFSSEFELVEGRNQKLIDLCNKVGATEYYSGPSARGYLDESLFSNAHIQLRYLDYSGYPTYRQLHGPFVHEVSILDLIFNEGPDAQRHMKSFGAKALEMGAERLGGKTDGSHAAIDGSK